MCYTNNNIKLQTQLIELSKTKNVEGYKYFQKNILLRNFQDALNTFLKIC